MAKVLITGATGFILHDGVSDTFQNFSTRIAAYIRTEAPRHHIPCSLACCAG